MWNDDREERGKFREVGMCGQIATGRENYVKELNCVLNEASWGAGRVQGLDWKNGSRCSLRGHRGWAEMDWK